MQIYFCTLFFFLPLVNNKMQFKKVKFGEPVTLNCTENKKPVTYMYWKYKNVTANVKPKEIYSFRNKEITTKPPFENVIYPAGDFENGNYSITLSSITFKYGGQYTCHTQIHGSDAKQTSAFNIDVVGWEKNDSIFLGDTLNLSLHTNESVQLDFWRNGEKHNVGKIQINSQKCDLDNRYKNRFEMGNEVLRIHRVTPDDAGVYTVQDERSGKNISIVRLEITNPKDLSNSTSKNSTGQGPPMADELKNLLIGISVCVVLLICICAIFLCKRGNIRGPRHDSRSVSYRRKPQVDAVRRIRRRTVTSSSDSVVEE
nr:uncharacterized protein LOC111841347 [Paramormyrops kingsleyae]XP_023662805.1 uncharacterized protein LOC111841347 [Paramormyrops kingsleyae]